MIKLNCVHLDMLMDDFSLLEQKIAEVNGKNNIFEIMLEDASRQMKFYQTKEKSLIEERDSLLVTVNRLQQTLQEQCNLRVENERLKSEMASLKQHNERAAEDGKAELQRLIVWCEASQSSEYSSKLQFFQEEKNKEIAVLRQRIKELEENQRVSVFSDSRLKKRKI
ncbi:hypothetical protein JOQ06_008674 [Pogonophryne albipinna]|uniref:Coiled-coil domain-containing protein 152 n=1 Tax=Pogonophryne albipinna TaxID=1090488 RepID=A0AAD6F9L8_9TELE|nr:hypothetical protein JOQ06_008674 [Pogonophryne albipinna]